MNYGLYHSGGTWQTGPFSGFHISRKGLGVANRTEGKNKFCLINGKTPDGLNIVLKYYCNQQDYPKGKLFLIKVGNQKLKLDVENINLTNDIADFGCICPQG